MAARMLRLHTSRMPAAAFLFFKIFVCCRKHKLNTVELIYLRCTRIVIDGNNVCLRVFVTQFFDHTFSYDVIWQAGKWLCTDDVWNSLMHQL